MDEAKNSGGTNGTNGTNAPETAGDGEDSRNLIVRAYHFFEGKFGQGTIAGLIFVVGFFVWIAFFDPLL